MYDTIDELLREIEADEDTFLELKEVVFKGDQVRFSAEEGRASAVIAEVLISMANTAGGVVLFGVNKYREVVGVDPEKRGILEQFVVNCALNNCLPPLEPLLDWVVLPNKLAQNRLCLKVEIPRARYYVHQTTDGRYLKRVGSHRQPIPADQLGRLLATRALTIPFEERPAPKATLDVLDRKRFESYYEAAFGTRVEDSGLPFERLLGNLKLAAEVEDRPWQPTNLGILLFSDRPELHISGAFIDIAVYDHDEADGNTLDSKRVVGALPDQIEATLRYLLTSPHVATLSSKDEHGRLDRPVYSAFALQEAVVNAIVHRDYQLAGSQIIVTLFPDRIEVRNPGGLHNSLVPENLFAGCQPVRRNQMLAGFLRGYRSQLGRSYMEQRGEGFLTLVRESQRLSGRRPSLTVTTDSVRLTIFALTPDA
ncbi:MAG: hypothetical protein HC897_10000 [Thermoanaerobaculia bacterium]|nr:hypothetical protein [Thermoanaerobaculia bacterium]